MRWLIPSLLSLLALTLPAADLAPTPQPPLPPEPRTLHLAPGSRAMDERPLDRAGLAADIEALARTVKRVESTLGDKTTQDDAAHAATGETPEHGTPGSGEHAANSHAAANHGHGESGGLAQTATSERYGARLTLTTTDTTELVHADLDGESVEQVLGELTKLAGIKVEDARVPGLRRTIALRLHQLPLAETFDRLLGQAGISWRLDGEGDTRHLLMTIAPGPEDEDLAAERALERARDAAAAAGNSAAEAEARYLLARRLLDRERPIEAMRRFNELVQAMSTVRDSDAQAWIQRAIRGLGDSMVALKQWQDARSVYRNYIGRAKDGDADLASVYLASAEAGRQSGLQSNDPLAFDEAIADLHALLEKFGDDRSKAEVVAARLLIGGLLYDAKRWAEAEAQLARYAAESGSPTDQIAFQLAECAFQLGKYRPALDGFNDLLRRWRAGTTTARPAVYEQAAYRIGLCHLREVRPRFVHALFAFQRAQEAFPKSKLTPELLLNIARCYAEIEREDEAVAALWELLKQENLTGAASTAETQSRLDQEMGSLLGRLSEYPGPVRAKAMFYIAQAEHRRAERDRSSRAVVAAQAVGYYERVLSENPPVELRDAARIGLARASFLAGNAERGVLELTQALREPGLGERDRAYAARLLGDHLRSEGKTREAIEAYQGTVK